jgi:hypothetical protein
LLKVFSNQVVSQADRSGAFVHRQVAACAGWL